MSRDPLWTGVQRHGAGWRASVSQGRGRPLIQRHFPHGTSPRDMQAWRADTKAGLRLTRKQRASYGTFEGDAKRYLRAVTALTTYEDRTREIGLWIDVFGTTPRDRITSADIREQRDAWLTEPRSRTDKRPVAPATVNKRLRALSNLWRVLDGRLAANPVRDVPEAPEPTPAARTASYEQIAKLLDALPHSKTKARIRVLAYTGWPIGVLTKLTADDVDLTAGLARLPPRHKGTGAAGVVVPLVPQAVAALKDFARLKCWGKCSRHSLRTSFKRAAKKAGLPWLRPYDLRHLYASALAAASQDERAVAAVLQHADLRTTRRYTLGSVPVRVTLAVEKLSAALEPGMTFRHDQPAQTPAKPNKTAQRRSALQPRSVAAKSRKPR